MTPLPGVSGHLLSTTFLADQIAPDPRADERSRRELVAWRSRCASLGPATAPRGLMQGAAAPLCELLGFDRPSEIDVVAGVAAASIRHRHAVAALIATPWGEPFDERWRLAVSQAVQRGASWCLLFDGRRLRVVDATRLYARRYVEFDLDLVADDRQTWAAFLRVCHASRLAAVEANGSLRALVAASDRHAAGVCRSLRNGVLTASTEVLRALVGRRTAQPHVASGFSRTSQNRTVDDALEQALTVVYRILFLLFAEARALVPLWHPIYRESYSVESLCDAAEGSARPVGLWDALRAIARLAHGGCRAGDLRVTAFNGRLFAPARTPLADRRDLDDDAARRAVMALSTRPAPDGAGRERIAYHDLGVEQLGAVYETLLDYEPHVEGRTVSLRSGSGIRKETGTFYTPQPIAYYLVRRTLEPLVRDATPDRILQLRVVDPAMGSGAFLVAACRYLAGAYETAIVEAGNCHPSDIDEAARASFRRAIAERCLYGVDLNPMAVQLARLSLWLATLAADRPLSFLDHRLQAGDSLLGTWLSRLRRPPQRHARESSLPLFDEEAVAVALREALPIRFSLESTPNDTVEQVRVKERAFAQLTARHGALSRWKRIAHLWCSAWLAPADAAVPAAAFGPLSDAALTGRGALPPDTARRHLAASDQTGADRRLFHWELEFPEVFFDREGRRLARAGFDAVIGNPPWDMIRADAGEADARRRTKTTTASTLRFTRDSGVYAAQSAGHANRYQLFVERAIALTRDGGRIGLVLPSGLATDHGSGPLRRLLLSRCDVDAIVGMDNHRGVFPIHRSVRFLLVTASTGSPTKEIACRLGLDDPAALESIDDGAAPSTATATARASVPVRLTPALLERISGPALTIPNVCAPIDLAIVERAATLFPPLASPAGWHASFGRELNATEDRAAFRHGRNGLPVVDGKHVEPFRVAFDGIERSVSAADARRLLNSDRHEHARLAYRDVASATNRLTLIAAVLPPRCISTHTVFCLRTPLPPRAHYFLCGLFNSFVVNYLVRLRVTTHVTTATVERLPMPGREDAPAAFADIAALARLLSRRRDAAAFARLNARVAQLYQLSAPEFEHILGTFPLIPIEERHRALGLFRENTR